MPREYATAKFGRQRGRTVPGDRSACSPMYQPCARKIRRKKTDSRPPVPNHLGAANGTDLSR